MEDYRKFLVNDYDPKQKLGVVGGGSETPDSSKSVDSLSGPVAAPGGADTKSHYDSQLNASQGDSPSQLEDTDLASLWNSADQPYKRLEASLGAIDEFHTSVQGQPLEQPICENVFVWNSSDQKLGGLGIEPGGRGSVGTAERFAKIEGSLPKYNPGETWEFTRGDWSVERTDELTNITNTRTGVVDTRWDVSAFPDEELPRDATPRTEPAKIERTEPITVKTEEAEQPNRDDSGDREVLRDEAQEAKTDQDQRGTRETGETDKSRGTLAELHGPTERDRALKDLEKITLRGEPFLKAAPQFNHGCDVPIFVVENQKILGFKPNGDLHGNVEGYWEGSSGTNRPATNLEPGTYIVDRSTLKVYSAPTGDVLGKIMSERGRVASDVLAKDRVGLFLPSVWRAPSRHVALQKAMDGQRVVVIRVPRRADMVPADRNPWGKVKEALHRAGTYSGPEAARAIRDMLKHPEMLPLLLTGEAGFYLFGTHFARSAGIATAIAQSAQTNDSIDVSARMYARLFGEGAALAGTAAMAKGAVAAVKGVHAGKGDPLLEPTAPETAADLGRADTMRENIGSAKTLPMNDNPLPGKMPQGPKFDHLAEHYYAGDRAQAGRSLDKVWEGDVDAALKGKEFGRRLNDYLDEHGGSISPEAARDLIRQVDEWHDQQFGGGTGSSGIRGGSGGHSGAPDRILGDRISAFDHMINEERARVAAVREGMSKADWNKVRAGETKHLYNLMETRHAHEMQRIHQDRTIYQQVKFVGIRTRDGTLHPIEGRGRIADWAELQGDTIQLGDIKSPSAFRGSVKGGLSHGPIEGIFRNSAEIAIQRSTEQKILQRARDLNGRVVFEGTNPITRDRVRFESEPGSVKPSRVTTYRSAPNN
jgi:hypothetical protein